MANLAKSTQYRHVGILVALQVGIYAAAKIYQGAMVCLRSADGMAVRAGTAGTGRVVGIAQAEAEAPVVSGDYSVNLLCGVFAIAPHATRPPVVADIGKAVYAADDQTVSNDAADGPLAGICVGFEASTGWPLVEIEPPAASAVDEAAIEIPVYPSILAAGTPMAAWADNAGASAPGIHLVDSEGMGIRWNNQAAQTAVWTRFVMPKDIDTSKDAYLEFFAAKTGATLADATTFTAAVFNQEVGALHDADADYGGASSAMVGNAPAKTVQKVSRTLAAANLGKPGEPVSLSFKPTDGTLGTDDVVLFGMRLRYRRKS